MNTGKVFTAFSIDNNELLLYRKDNNTFVDLLSKQNDVYPVHNIDLSTLMPASKSLRLRRNMLPSTVRKRYIRDREQLLCTLEIKLGDINKFKKAKFKYSGDNFWNMGVYCKWDVDFQYTSLFLQIKNPYDVRCKYIDILDGNIDLCNWHDTVTYENIGYVEKNDLLAGEVMNGKKYVLIHDVSLKRIVDTNYISKKQVYEVANQIKKKSLIMTI